MPVCLYSACMMYLCPCAGDQDDDEVPCSFGTTKRCVCIATQLQLQLHLHCVKCSSPGLSFDPRMMCKGLINLNKSVSIFNNEISKMRSGNGKSSI